MSNKKWTLVFFGAFVLGALLIIALLVNLFFYPLLSKKIKIVYEGEANSIDMSVFASDYMFNPSKEFVLSLGLTDLPEIDYSQHNIYVTKERKMRSARYVPWSENWDKTCCGVGLKGVVLLSKEVYQGKVFIYVTEKITTNPLKTAIMYY